MKAAFTEKPTLVRTPDTDKLEKLSQGFVLYDPLLSSDLGRHIRVNVSRQPGGAIQAYCNYFDHDDLDENNTARTRETALGFLTQEAFDRLAPHNHRSCEATLELRIDG
jgi:hypothetical protein